MADQMAVMADVADTLFYVETETCGPCCICVTTKTYWPKTETEEETTTKRVKTEKILYWKFRWVK